jgi:hypothetical protein
MITETTLEAIKTQYDNSPLPAFVEGLFYAGSTPDGLTGNYITYFKVTGSQEYTMSSRSERPTFQFSVWSDDTSPITCIRIAEMFMLWFDDCKLSIGGGSHIRIDRESDNLIPDPDGGYQYQIDYSILVEAN